MRLSRAAQASYESLGRSHNIKDDITSDSNNHHYDDDDYDLVCEL